MVDVNTDVDGQFGSTALHWACHHAREDTARLLLSKGANPNVCNAYQATPVHWACKTGQHSLVKLMLQHRGDPTLRTINGDTPLNVARQAGVADVLQDLLGAAPGPFSTKDDQKAVSNAVAPTTRPSATLTSSKVAFLVPTEGHLDRLHNSSSSSAVVPQPAPTVGVPGPSHSAMQALQRSKQKAELDLKNSQAMVEALQRECNELQLQKLQLTAKAQASGEVLAKVEVLQKEKIRLDIALKQAEAELAQLQRSRSGEIAAPSQDHQEALNKLLKEKKDLLNENHRLKETLEAQRQAAQMENSQRDTEIDDLRAEVNNLQVQKVRTEMQLRELSELKSMINELQREKALLELELTGKEELQRQVEGLQSEKITVEGELRDMQRKAGELQGVINGLKRHMEEIEAEVQALKETKVQLEQERREKGRLEIHAQTLQEELDARKELALTAIRGTEDAVGAMQNNLKALREEKTQLKQELLLQRSEAATLSQKLLELQRSTQGQSATTQEVEVLQASLQAAEQFNRAQEEKLAALRKSYEQLNEQLVEMQKQKVMVDVEVEELRRAKGQLQQLEEEKLQLVMEVKRASLAADCACESLGKMSKEHKFLAEQVQLLEGVQEANSRLQQEYGAAEERLRQQRIEIDKLSGDRTFWEAQWSASHAKEKAELQGQLTAAEAEIRRLQAEMKALVDQLVQAQASIGSLMDTKVAMEATTIQQLRAKVSELQKAKDALQSQTHQHQQAQEQLQRLAGLEDRLDAKEREIHDQNIVINDLKTRLKTLQDTLAGERRQAQGQIDQLKQQFAVEERRIRQTYQQELEQLHAAFENESAGLRQRSAIMDRERQALEMQIKALQEQATFAVQNATKRPLFEPSAIGSRLDPHFLDSASPFRATDRFNQTEPRPSALLAELGDLKHSISLPPLGASLSSVEAPTGPRKQPRPGAFAKEQRALVKGPLF
eukprot:GGOE01003164.1.p1 GENE.GGOE01003164.1~~GGOE01003164.1.p1  ORF type:complete len:992 (+),score=375.23 GGOE01003164.1:123-2978(+)